MMLEGRAEKIVQCGREITAEDLAEIKETVRLFPKLSRTELADTLCENLEWLTASGGYKRDACIKLLEKLESGGVIKVPEKRESKPRPRSKIVLTSRTEPQEEIKCRLEELSPVSIEVVKDKERAKLWNEYVSRYHYLGYKHPFGTFMKYFVVCNKGLLGCILFAGAAKSMGIRDKWIGWDTNERLRNLGWVTNNSRFLIFQWVHVKNLASHVLGQVGRRIGDDWNDRWGFRPALMETFVEPQRYHGSSYKASNWEHLGMTTGAGLVRTGKRYATTPKMIFVKPLVKNFRAILCSEELKRER